MDPASAARAKALQLAIDSARKRVNAQRKSDKIDSPRVVKFVERIGFVEGYREDGSAIAYRFVNGERHHDTGLNHFVIVSRKTAREWARSSSAKHKWEVRRSSKGDYEVRLVPPSGGANNSLTAARAIYDLEYPGKLISTRYRVVIKEQDHRRNGLDLELSRLDMESPTQHRPRKITRPAFDLDDLSDEVDRILASQEA